MAKTIDWQLLVVMAQRKVRKITDLQKRLSDYGCEISTQQLGRVAAARPERLNMDLLEGLINVLDCDVSDLIRVVESQDAGNDSTPDTTASAPARKKVATKPKRVRTSVSVESASVPAPPPFRVLDPVPKG